MVETPGETCIETTQQSMGCDTEFTPVAKDGCGEWAQIAGAVFPGTAPCKLPDAPAYDPDASPAPFTTDFFANAFFDEQAGFFAGAQCSDPETPPEGLDACERVPAIYAYRTPPGQPAELEQVMGPQAPGSDAPGYVGALAWIGPSTAIAVGGTGYFPRRELARDPGGPFPGDEESHADYADRDLEGAEENASGRARAWLLKDGSWKELSVPDVAGEPAHGLTTVDCSPRPADAGLCLAGGYRQLFSFGSGEVEESWSPTTVDEGGEATVSDGAGWRFRVRSLRFVPGEAISVNGPAALAVTSGCCAADTRQNTARLLIYDQDAQRWRSRLLANDAFLTGPNGQQGNRDTLRENLPPQSIPDSYYSLDRALTSVIASPGGPEPDPADPAAREPASRVIIYPALRGEPEDSGSDVDAAQGTAQSCAGLSSAAGRSNADLTGGVCGQVSSPRLTDARLVSGDGDFDRRATPTDILPQDGGTRDFQVDWAVGSFTRSGTGHDDRAAAYTTTRGGPRPGDAPNPLDCPVLDPGTDCAPRDAAEIAEETKSATLYELPSYALNSIAYVPSGALAFAAGDRGAIMRLGGSGGIAGGSAEPDPPRLAQRRPEALNDASAYQGLGPAAQGPAGEVPALHAQPLQKLEGPQLVPYGAPAATDTAGAQDEQDNAVVVMSRDGSEGWALGGSPTKDAQGTIFHYAGGRWSRCEANGISGQLPPDPACAGLGFLGRAKPAAVQIQAAARVPLERDSDPSNDDEFEAVVLGTNYRIPGSNVTGRMVLRYREGRWSVDERAVKEIGAPPLTFGSIAFSAPDDGWVALHDGKGAELYRYDGERWITCGENRATCGDPAGTLPHGIQDKGDPIATLTFAGERLYLAGTRAGNNNTPPFFPLILSLDTSDPEATWLAEHDPGCISRDPGTGGCVGSDDPADQGKLTAFSAAEDAEGRVFGWAAGKFGTAATDSVDVFVPGIRDPARRLGADTRFGLLRLDPGASEWHAHTADDAAADYLFAPIFEKSPPKLFSGVGPDGEELSFLSSPFVSFERQAGWPVLRFESHADDPAGGRWRVQEAPFAVPTQNNSQQWRAIAGGVQGMAPDGGGGAWLAVRQAGSTEDRAFFYRYADRAPKEVFQDAPHPIREQITDLAGSASGDVWVSTDSSAVYRYDRISGWERARIPGWDPGRVVTNPSPASAVAVGPGGEGIVVGPGGRIAEVSAEEVRLDRAAGAALCAAPDAVAPCSTGRTLVSAAVAPDGSAMTGGQARALLWSPAGGEFRAIEKPLTAVNATLTGISMPAPERAYLTTDTGQIFRGTRSGESWSWELENLNEDKQLVTLNAGGQGIPLADLAVDAAGHGYAVGRQGLVLERTGDPEQPWRRIASGVRDHLYSVALPPGGGSGALIGGGLGLILTVADGELELARTNEFTDPLTAALGVPATAEVRGLALLPGLGAGQVEAWAATSVGEANPSRSPDPSAILHYTNASGDPLLSGRAPERAAPLPDAEPSRPGELRIGAFGRSDCHHENSGEGCNEPAGTNFLNEVIPRRIAAELDPEEGRDGGAQVALFTGDVSQAAGRNSSQEVQRPETPLSIDLVHRRWREVVADGFYSREVPLFGALGAQDLSQVLGCTNPAGRHCESTGDTGAGLSNLWRESFAGMPAPWGSGERAGGEDLSFVPVESAAPEAPGGGAATHYAFDVVRGANNVARVVVLDSSLRSLPSSQPNQNPTEEQTGWLTQMICKRGSPADTAQAPCTREPDQRAIVLSNTPTYSYGSGALSDTAIDGTVLESLYRENEVDAVVQGRVGWNGLYYETGGGLHAPQPGEPHPDPSEPPPSVDGGRSIPYVIASSAGGTFGPVGQEAVGAGSEGFWHGYTMVRVPAPGAQDSRILVEQRPIVDWVGIEAAQRKVRATKRVTLEGYALEAPGTDEPLRYLDITTQAITHRYDLVEANPDEPWLPKEAPDNGTRSRAAERLDEADPCGPYLCLDPKVGTVDDQSGQVRAGKGNYPRTYAIGVLSVGEQAATYPLVFEPRASFRAPTPPPARPAALPPPPGTPSQPPQPNPPTVEALVPPVLPNLTAAPPPAPPVPPTPPPAEAQTPLDLNLAPTALEVNPPTAVSQPPTPPVNPAPPGGARKEARQRQAAAQKSGADPAEEGSEAQEMGGDLADGPPIAQGSEMTRHDFTAVAEREQPSAWTRDALIGGGLGIAALILALGLRTARPTPRRREPEIPAPAWSRTQRRR